MAAEKLDLRFIVTVDRASGSEFAKFSASIVYVSAQNEVRYPSGHWSGSLEAPYADLRVTAQANLDRSDKGDWYAQDVAYHPSSVDLRQAEIMVKTLRKLQAKLVKLEQEFGHATDLTTFFARVAHSLGITLFAMRDSYTGDRWGVAKAEDYRWTEVQGILYSITSAHQALLKAAGVVSE